MLLWRIRRENLIQVTDLDLVMMKGGNTGRVVLGRGEK
jgi:hypothetical protein